MHASTILFLLIAGEQHFADKALERMEQQRIDSLPVIHTGCFFMGTVDCRKLTASLILPVIQRLDGAGQ
ncbi:MULTISPECIES: hypothetical protein [unclassified Pseudomonas]|uniref:hypothetical protein n=1 Tax=unclassified Pseudomonas TaxID=196821 RepID=UPI00244C6C10|nr:MULTISPECIES: hypothetical protein [unclassified Pseudomonas]MDG9924856.1 hypothetical protein [Pseudomonas sp. GD04045]MDH0036137.1 hypothetical protein [Pseudomonas sp. GD04019]